jgi:hypothetical protein
MDDYDKRIKRAERQNDKDFLSALEYDIRIYKNTGRKDKKIEVVNLSKNDKKHLQYAQFCIRCFL